MAMGRYKVEASRVINASAARVWAILADYQEGHPAILPPKYFRDLEVVEGGVGAGTVITFQMHLLGATSSARMVVSEPEPGRILQETDASTGVTTTFILDPQGGGQGVRVTFRTELRSRGGPFGVLERFLVRGALRRVYAEELSLLAALAEKGAQTPGASSARR
jgi:hypothetical protein